MFDSFASLNFICLWCLQSYAISNYENSFPRSMIPACTGDSVEEYKSALNPSGSEQYKQHDGLNYTEYETHESEQHADSTLEYYSVGGRWPQQTLYLAYFIETLYLQLL